MVENEILISYFSQFEFGNLCFVGFFVSKKCINSAQGFSVLEGSGNKSLSPELMKSSL